MPFPPKILMPLISASYRKIDESLVSFFCILMAQFVPLSMLNFYHHRIGDDYHVEKPLPSSFS